MIVMKKKKGFTLIEALLACTLIGILLISSVPMFQEFAEKARTKTLAEELYNDLNSTKIAAISVGQEYNFEFLLNGWEVTRDGLTLKKKEFTHNNLYIEEKIGSFIFKPLGFTADSKGNTISEITMNICNTKNQYGYAIKINAFGKTKLEEIKCT